MGYTGIPLYEPKSYSDLEEFIKFSSELFTGLIGSKFNGYYAVFDELDQYISESPIILKFNNTAIEISTEQSEMISLTKNHIDLSWKIDWYDEKKYFWKETGIEFLDALIDNTLQKIEICYLDWGTEIGKSIHGLIFTIGGSEILIVANDEILITEPSKTLTPEHVSVERITVANTA